MTKSDKDYDKLNEHCDEVRQNLCPIAPKIVTKSDKYCDPLQQKNVAKSFKKCDQVRQKL